MTFLQEHKQNIFIGLLGKRAGLKLMSWLDPCCNTFCADVNSCVGVSSSGDPTLFLNQAGTFTAPNPDAQITTSVDLTSAQILALNTTPVSLVPAPGAGKAIIVDEVIFELKYNSVAYTGSNAVEFAYTNGSGTLVAGTIPSTVLDATVKALGIARGSNIQATVNAPVVVFVPTANPAAGNSPATVTIKYRIITL